MSRARGRRRDDSPGRGKGPLPSKVCPVCGRPFTWRKKWERDWDRVVYCSDKCRRTGSRDAS